MIRSKYGIAVGLLLCVLAVLAVFFWWTKRSAVVAEPEKTVVYLRDIATLPIFSDTIASVSASPKASDLLISAEAAYISDLESGAVLYRKNEFVQRSPASTTKLLTALVALEHFKLEDILTVSSEATTAGQVVGLFPGEQLYVKDLIQAMLISSGNDAAYVLANNYPGGNEAFVRRMNELAKEIGMQSSYFQNPAGFDHDTHYSTAYDLSVLAREAIKSPFIKETVATATTTIYNTSGMVPHVLRTTNQLLLENPFVVGIKTGTTEKAGQVLISQYQTNGSGDILVVMMGSKDRFSDTRSLADWVYGRYQWKLFSAGQ